MNEQQASRLVDVATALRDAADKKWFFDMDTYGRRSGFLSGRRGFIRQGRQMEKEGCGTPACALGHYAHRTDLQDFLRLSPDGLLYYTGKRWEASYWHTSVRRHFGLTHEEASYLFSSSGCHNAKKPLQAAEFIEDFVESRGFDIVEEAA